MGDSAGREGWCDPTTGAPDARRGRGALARLWRRLCAMRMLNDERWLRSDGSPLPVRPPQLPRFGPTPRNLPHHGPFSAR